MVYDDDTDKPEIQIIHTDDRVENDEDAPLPSEEIRRLIVELVTKDPTLREYGIRDRLRSRNYEVSVASIRRFLAQIRPADRRA
ncbi:hypothetical protein [Thermoactinospora rubra]|uniref:hypothetical protein n=1 Tax=Thermoactinospora rubra TaxID=1088767 RepID=UPI000A1230F1|nr:hypothetical protein [Thermoactinospora rubra]